MAQAVICALLLSALELKNAQTAAFELLKEVFVYTLIVWSNKQRNNNDTRISFKLVP